MCNLSEVLYRNIDNSVQEGNEGKLLALLYLQNRLSTLPDDNCNQDNAKNFAEDLQKIQKLPPQEQEVEISQARVSGKSKGKGKSGRK